MVLPTKTPLAPALGTIAPSLALISHWRQAGECEGCSPSPHGRPAVEIRGAGPQGGSEWTRSGARACADCKAHQQCPSAPKEQACRLPPPHRPPAPVMPQTWDSCPQGLAPSPCPQAQEGQFPQPLPHPATAHPLCAARTMSAQTGWGMGLRHCQHSAGPLGGQGPRCWVCEPPRGPGLGHTCVRAGTWQVSCTHPGARDARASSIRAAECVRVSQGHERGSASDCRVRHGACVWVKTRVPLTPCLCAPHWRVRGVRRP